MLESKVALPCLPSPSWPAALPLQEEESLPRACPWGNPAHLEETPSLRHQARGEYSFWNAPGLLLLSHCISYASHICVSHSPEPLYSVPSAVGSILETASIY